MCILNVNFKDIAQFEEKNYIKFVTKCRKFHFLGLAVKNGTPDKQKKIHTMGYSKQMVKRGHLICIEQKHHKDIQ